MTVLKRVFHELVNIGFVVVTVVFLLFLVRTHIASPFTVSGYSMQNTLMNGKRMFLFKNASIERFDIVVFPDPRGGEDFYIKRLIGLPGDRLYVEDDQLYINDVSIAEPYLDSLKSTLPAPFTNDFTLYDITGNDTIPEGYGFVMGDNRPNSGDSRQFGLVPLTSILGEATVVYFPWANRRIVTDYEFDDSTQSMIYFKEK